jgi:hypothetical protein
LIQIDWPRLVRALLGKPEPVQEFINELRDFPTLADLEDWYNLPFLKVTGAMIIQKRLRFWRKLMDTDYLSAWYIKVKFISRRYSLIQTVPQT